MIYLVAITTDKEKTISLSVHIKPNWRPCSHRKADNLIDYVAVSDGFDSLNNSLPLFVILTNGIRAIFATTLKGSTTKQFF